ncbi:nicotinamide riboside transporter PnuC [Dysgonomonas sp. GY617]|uniref:nicotinamide riboside transporter PnuC n=1 Tax=Dysgonomonas sp. GY617 TaxID=2780420 RepID=UPI0018844ECD|nr:nicotinamide riboside transporter PnuC [Dysgonomonas sp. GY617]MBF0574554.1 nicotinamide mononucleotide transporter [Dysgonomonas sp. GY617]
MRRIVVFLDYVTGKGSVRHTQIWFAIAVILTSYTAYGILARGEDTVSNVAIYSITALLGYLSVVSLAFRKPISGNVLGITANLGEMYSQFQFRNIGLVFSAGYYLLFHVVGLITWTKKENQDEGGRVKTTTTNQGFVIFTIISGIVGCACLYLYGSQWGLINQDQPLLLYLNILAFVVGILSQMIMILRKPWAWYMWLTSNVIWFVLNLMSGNYIFMVQSVLYEWNCILAIYIWHKESNQ